MSLQLNIMVLRTTLLTATALICFGCGDKSKYGKYTEEQMQQIELANKYNLPEASGDSMAIAVFSETITSDEILGATEKYLEPMAGRFGETTFHDQARPLIQQAIRGKITDILLYQEAKKNSPENVDDMLEKAVEGEINRFIASYGNNYALAEAKIREMGMDWRSFREYQKKLIMTQSYINSQLKEELRFSNQQLLDFYNANREELFCPQGQALVFRLIHIQPDLLTPEQIGSEQSPQAAAKDIADTLIERLKTDQADFAELAKQYHGPMAPGGGKVSIFKPGTNELPDPYNTLESYAMKMQIDQITGPVEIDGQIFILKLDTKEDCKSFDEAKPLIRQHLTFTYRQKKYQELVKNLDNMASFAQMDRFMEFCIKQAYTRWGQS